MKTFKTARVAGWLAAATLVGAALLAPATTLATPPPPDHTVTICHRTASDTNPYDLETVDIASSGHLQGGHDTEHRGPIWDATLKAQHIDWGDIVPPYTYQDFSYVGQNWTEQGQAILAADCTIPTSETTTTTSSETTAATTSQTTSSETTAATTSQTTTSQTTTSQTTSSETTASTSSTTSASTTTAGPNGAVLGETGVSQITPPPTDTVVSHGTPADGSWRMLLLLAAAILASLLVMTPATARKRH